MILTILKQTVNYHLEENEYEIANTYAEMYSKMIMQYMNKKNQAVAALKDLAYDFHSFGYNRNAIEYFEMIYDHFDIKCFDENDLCTIGEIHEKLGHLNEASVYFHRIISYFPTSQLTKKACQKLSRIYSQCSNQNKAIFFKQLSDEKRLSKIRRKTKELLKKTKKTA